MIVDLHAHVIVPALLRDAAPAEAWRPRVYWDAGRQVIEHGGRRLTSAVREFVDPDGILAAQDAAGVDCVVLSPWASLLRYDVPPVEGLRTSRLYNEGLARLAEAHPTRIRALGTVPLQDPELAARELETVLRLPGLCGVEVAASVNGAYLGDDRFRPFWAAAEATGAVVFVHPTTRGFDLPALADYYLWNAVGNPLETTIAAAQMVLAGVLEAHPRLKVVLAHGGGALPALRGRLRHAHRVTAPARARLREPVDASLRRFYYDTVTHDVDLLRGLVAYASPEQVVLGSDYPFDMGVEQPAEAVRALGLPPEEEAKILGGNAARLLARGA
ncbi:MAG: amidohydrolase family protein [Armatimonadota bacterium]|nr:amidohydrolase family protein [Armatimonadota bacterium]